MIKVEHIETFNWEGAIRGMRNPLNSHDKSDSFLCIGNCDMCDRWTVGKYLDGTVCRNHVSGEFVIGENDLALMRKLCRAGSDHRKFLRQILVSMDITAPLYWWKEFDTYKVGTVANSCSTMHKIHAAPFTRADFSCERMTDPALAVLDGVIAFLEEERQAFCETKDIAHWHNMIQLLPTSYNQRRTVTLNYEVLLNIYHARKNHKLDEWHTMCDTIADMPYFYDICLSEEKTNA